MIDQELQIIHQILSAYWVLLLYLPLIYLFLRVNRAIPRLSTAQEVPLSGLELLAIFFVVYIFWAFVASYFVLWSGLATKLYPPILVEGIQSSGQFTKFSHQVGMLGGSGSLMAMELEVSVTQTRLGLWAAILFFPLQMASILVLLHVARRISASEIGFHWQRGWSTVGLAALTWLVVSPIVLLLNVGVQLFYHYFIPGGPSPHPFTTLFLQGVTPLELGLLLAIACIAAPVLEETLFRGILQPWCMKSSQRRLSILLFTTLWVVMNRAEKLMTITQQSSWLGVLDALLPFLILAGITFVVHALERRETSSQALAIICTSACFSFFHIAHWPSPIALFVLSLGLGWLAVRTRSLVGPIVLHALFNAISGVQLLLSLQQ